MDLGNLIQIHTNVPAQQPLPAAPTPIPAPEPAKEPVPA